MFQTFEGNSDSEGVTRHELLRSIVARYVRFVPLQWSKEGRMGLRVEVYGCSYCESTSVQSLFIKVHPQQVVFSERTVRFNSVGTANSPSHYHAHNKKVSGCFLWFLLLRTDIRPQIHNPRVSGSAIAMM